MKKLDLPKIIEANPAVDAGQLGEVVSIIKALREQGVTGARYNLVAPFTRRPGAPPEKPEDDPRAVRLRT